MSRNTQIRGFEGESINKEGVIERKEKAFDLGDFILIIFRQENNNKLVTKYAVLNKKFAKRIFRGFFKCKIVCIILSFSQIRDRNFSLVQKNNHSPMRNKYCVFFK